MCKLVIKWGLFPENMNSLFNFELRDLLFICNLYAMCNFDFIILMKAWAMPKHVNAIWNCIKVLANLYTVSPSICFLLSIFSRNLLHRDSRELHSFKCCFRYWEIYLRSIEVSWEQLLPLTTSNFEGRAIWFLSGEGKVGRFWKKIHAPHTTEKENSWK